MTIEKLKVEGTITFEVPKEILLEDLKNKEEICNFIDLFLIFF